MQSLNADNTRSLGSPSDSCNALDDSSSTQHALAVGLSLWVRLTYGDPLSEIEVVFELEVMRMTRRRTGDGNIRASESVVNWINGELRETISGTGRFIL